MAKKNVEARKPLETYIAVTAPHLQLATFDIEGTSPYVQLRFSEKVRNQIKAKQEAGSTEKTKKVREARDFHADYVRAMYEAPGGKRGIPAAAFRCAMVSACRLVNYKMTIAKMSVFIEADMLDKTSQRPLVKIIGKPEMNIDNVRNADGGLDLRSRAMWRTWKAQLRVKYDADQFSLQDITNLLRRVGSQLGIGEGRYDSKMSGSCGLGYGCFRVRLDTIKVKNIGSM